VVFGPVMVAPVIMASGNKEQQERSCLYRQRRGSGGARATASPVQPDLVSLSAKPNAGRLHFIVNVRKTWTNGQ
jgi:hypothetical protein